VGLNNWRREIYRAIELIEQARASGQDVTVDFYPYEGGSTMLSTMVPPSYLQDDPIGSLRRLKDPRAVEFLRRECAKEHPLRTTLAIYPGLGPPLLIIGLPRTTGNMSAICHRNCLAYGFDDRVGHC
jgi:hypothetical protein